MIPTVGFNMRKVSKGNVTIKVGRGVPGYVARLHHAQLCACAAALTLPGNVARLSCSTVCMCRSVDSLLTAGSPRPVYLQLWDIGGQPRFRSMWERYCRGVQVIV